MQETYVKIALPISFIDSLVYRLKPELGFDDSYIGRRVTVPFRNQIKVGIILGLCSADSLEKKKIMVVDSIIDEQPIIESKLLEFYHKTSQYYLYPLGEVIFSGIPKWYKSIKLKPLPKESWWRVRQTLPKDRIEAIKSVNQRAVFEFIQNHGPVQSKSMTHVVKSASTQCKALQKKGLILESETPFAQTKDVIDPQFTLTDDQSHAYEQISESKNFTPFLLDGITGSGKTEIYIRLIQKALDSNLQSLVLVPEIGLTPQLFHEISRRIHGKVAVLHSGLSDVARAKSWIKAKDGFYNVIVATRSGIFTPFKNLGQIIVDEEHDLSFKQQSGFRYSARDLAVLRGQLENIPVILGSATPSLETFQNAQSNKYQWIKLRQRTNKKALPEFQIHDTRNYKINKGLSLQVLKSIQQELDRGQQVLVFLNRRGWSPKLHCEECSWVAECSECDSYLTYHKHMNRLKCHQCDRIYSIPEFCPDCGSQKIVKMGVGTEKIEAGLLASLPESKVIRVDRDTVRTPTQWQAALDEIRTGEPCVLIGTQMLSKGHDFPKLTLVVIVNVDNSFYSLDFRATEHLSQLLIQVSGRAGRQQQSGKVMIQTQCPENPFFDLLINKSYEEFATHEIKQREKMGFPPGSFMAILRCQSKNEGHLMEFFEALEKKLQVPDCVQCFGPLPSPQLKKIGFFHYQLVITGKQRNQLHAFLLQLRKALQQQTNRHRVQWNLDRDPVNMN